MFVGEGGEAPPDAAPPGPATPRATGSRFLVPKPGDPVYNADSIGRINTRMRGSNGALIAPATTAAVCGHLSRCGRATSARTAPSGCSTTTPTLC
jgi:hypothetical protein